VKLYFFSGGAACQETMTAEEFGMKLYSFPTIRAHKQSLRLTKAQAFLFSIGDYWLLIKWLSCKPMTHYYFTSLSTTLTLSINLLHPSYFVR